MNCQCLTFSHRGAVQSGYDLLVCSTHGLSILILSLSLKSEYILFGLSSTDDHNISVFFTVTVQLEFCLVPHLKLLSELVVVAFRVPRSSYV